MENKDLEIILEAEGLAPEEIQNIFLGLKDIEENNTYTAEEVHEYLFNKKIEYA
jgi:hypothetical protein